MLLHGSPSSVVSDMRRRSAIIGRAFGPIIENRRSDCGRRSTSNGGRFNRDAMRPYAMPSPLPSSKATTLPLAIGLRKPMKSGASAPLIRSSPPMRHSINRHKSPISSCEGRRRPLPWQRLESLLPWATDNKRLPVGFRHLNAHRGRSAITKALPNNSSSNPSTIGPKTTMDLNKSRRKWLNAGRLLSNPPFSDRLAI